MKVKSGVTTVSKNGFKVYTTEQLLHLLGAEDFGLSESKGGDKKEVMRSIPTVVSLSLTVESWQTIVNTLPIVGRSFLRQP